VPLRWGWGDTGVLGRGINPQPKRRVPGRRMEWLWHPTTPHCSPAPQLGGVLWGPGTGAGCPALTPGVPRGRGCRAPHRAPHRSRQRQGSLPRRAAPGTLTPPGHPAQSHPVDGTTTPGGAGEGAGR